MSFLLDTNICSAHLRRPGGLAHRFMQHTGRLFISSIALAELYVWAEQRGRGDDLRQTIDGDLLADLIVVDFDRAAASEFGRLRADLLRRGIGVNPVDLMIASIAVARDLTVVTHNLRHFDPIPEVRCEDWLQ